MNTKHICFILFFVFSTGISISQESINDKMTSGQWSQDIDSFINGMEKVHVNPYHKTSKVEFQNFANDLKTKLPSMTDNQIVTEIARMVAMIGDGHTVVDISGFHNDNSSKNSKISFHSYPLEAYIFNEGLYIISSDDKYKDLIGLELVEVNGIKIETVMEKLKPIIPADNAFNINFSLPFFLMTAEYLNGLGFCPDDLKSDFIFEDKTGNRIVKSIEPVDINDFVHFLRNKKYSDSAPLYLQNNEKNYWFEYLPDKKILYINYKRVLNDPEDSLKYFCKRLQELINTHEIEKTIIDIRNNGGGNNATCQPFVDLISNNKKINVKGKLFTIIGRETFSAASYLTTKLEFNTNTIFVGEPTGARPNHYGDNRPLNMPNSGLKLRLSSIYWKNSFPFDEREYTEPEIKVDITAGDFFENRDPVLVAIINYNYPENNTAEISSADRKILAGKYLIEPLQYMEIIEEGKDLMLEIRTPDFIGRDVTYIHTPVYSLQDQSYSTGINGLKISQISNGVKLSYRGNDRDIPRINSNYKMPVQLFRDGKYNEARNLLIEVKNNYPDNANVSENQINNLGYIFVNEKNLEAAIEVFKLNTELYPEAFNTYDSLGEAYLMSGNKELAIINYKKSVELNSRNENGKKILEQLNAK